MSRTSGSSRPTERLDKGRPGGREAMRGRLLVESRHRQWLVEQVCARPTRRTLPWRESRPPSCGWHAVSQLIGEDQDDGSSRITNRRDEGQEPACAGHRLRERIGQDRNRRLDERPDDARGGGDWRRSGREDEGRALVRLRRVVARFAAPRRLAPAMRCARFTPPHESHRHRRAGARATPGLSVSRSSASWDDAGRIRAR